MLDMRIPEGHEGHDLRGFVQADGVTVLPVYCCDCGTIWQYGRA